MMLDNTLHCTHWLGLPLQTFFTPVDGTGNPRNGAPVTVSVPDIPAPVPFPDFLGTLDSLDSFLQHAETPTFLDQLQSAPIDQPYSTDLLLQSNVFRSIIDGAAHGGTPMFTGGNSGDEFCRLAGVADQGRRHAQYRRDP